MDDGQDKLFIFDDELCVEDEKHECIDGYLISTSGLVNRLKDIVKSDLSTQEFDSLEDINFYSFYNVQDGSIELVGTYWFMREDGLGVTETHGDVGISLKEHELRDLLASMEQYCHQRYGMSTLSFVNEARTHEGLCALERHRTDLDLPDQVDAWIKEPLDQMFEDYPVSERSASFSFANEAAAQGKSPESGHGRKQISLNDQIKNAEVRSGTQTQATAHGTREMSSAR